MTFFRTIVLCMVTLILFAACSSVPKSGKLQDMTKSNKPEDLNKGSSFYFTGITYYEEGEYADAEKNLKFALALGLADAENKIKAHKYLAFLYCSSERQSLCENEFMQAFDIDPGFTLSPAESGHPMWQPVYDKVKSQIAPVNKKP